MIQFSPAYYQVDNSYARNIESLVHKVCALSRQQGEEHRLLRAASLQCLSAMVIHSSLLSSLYFPDAFWQFFFLGFRLTDYHNVSADLVHEGAFIHIC